MVHALSAIKKIFFIIIASFIRTSIFLHGSCPELFEIHSCLTCKTFFFWYLIFLGHRAALSDASNVTVIDKQTQIVKAPTRIAEMPNFHTELRSMEVFSGQHVHLEAKISPADDPNLKVVWLFNGKVLHPSSF